MALNSVYFRITKEGESFSLPTLASSTVVAGKGVANADGYANLLAAISKFAGIAAQTPSFDGEVIKILGQGSEFYVKESTTVEYTYFDASSTADVQNGDPIYITPTGKLSALTTSNLQIGSAKNVISDTEMTVELNFVAATAKYTA